MTSPIAHIPDHAALGLDMLPAQLAEQPTAAAILRAILGEVQALEDALYALLTERGLDGATDAALDQLGELVGESRYGATDVDYRRRIRLRIHRNTSRGEPERLIRVLKELTDSASVYYVEPAPGVASLTFDGQDLPADLRAAMEDIAPAGVRLELIHAPPDGFVFSSIADPSGPPWGQGFSDLSGQVGGGLGKLV